MKEALEKQIAQVCKNLFAETVRVELTRPDERFGDFATNAALQLAGKIGRNPREVAEQIVSALDVEASVAGPGFINIRIPDDQLYGISVRAADLREPLKGQVVVAEYSDPNPFKVLHAGHLYTTLVGDAISNILETAGATVQRVNFGGDVGLHVGKAMWGIIEYLEGEIPEKLQSLPANERAEWVSQRYVEGNTAYESDEQAKSEIMAINKRIYKIHESQDKTSPFAQIYWICRQWSYDGFEQLYKELQVHPFTKYYPESETTPTGVKLVKEGLKKGIFETSNGAIVYAGEKDGLHTRVFMTGEGLPTYEAKDLGLSECKWQDFKFDKSIIITADDIVEYMKVVLKALSHFHPEVAEHSTHLTHGLIKMPGGGKMSSRTGNTLLASDILESAVIANQEARGEHDQNIVLGAVRYSFLKNRIGGDIIYDPKESVSLDGHSGPYLQYALVRARSILAKTRHHDSHEPIEKLDTYERSLARQLSLYSESFETSLADYSPHHIANYLYDLAVAFNRFYENSRVIDDPREAIRSKLVKSYESVLSHGLKILGMPTPEKM